MKVTNDENEELPWDGKILRPAQGSRPGGFFFLFTRAAAPNSSMRRNWFDTGDVAHIDAFGYMQITDRAKDVIKSGGEWISTIEIENLAVGHPDVAEAAVIGVAHPKWDERPLLVVVVKEGRSPSKQSLLDFLEGKIAKWWMPDDVLFVEEIPHTATGKIQKTALRDQLRDYRLPTA